MSAPAAAIDIGSSSVKLLVARPTPAGPADVLLDDVVVTRLSQGVDATGRLHPDASARTLRALAGFVEAARALGATRFATVGTAVLRDAEDAGAFRAACAEMGLDIEIVDGDAEADIVTLGARREVAGLPDDAVLVDIGGGSTEVVWPGGRESTELGTVRLTERHVDRDPPGPATLARLRSVVDTRLARLGLRPAAALVGSSGTCSLLVQLHLGLPAHDPARIHGFSLPLAALSALTERLAAATQAERLAMAGMDPRRADVILAGAVVLERSARAVGVTAVRVSDRGTRYGIFHRAFGG